jgi:hypothetical protein
MVSLSLLACMYKFIDVLDFAETVSKSGSQLAYQGRKICPSHFTTPYEIQIMREQLF